MYNKGKIITGLVIFVVQVIKTRKIITVVEKVLFISYLSDCLYGFDNFTMFSDIFPVRLVSLLIYAPLPDVKCNQFINTFACSIYDEFRRLSPEVGLHLSFATAAAPTLH